MNDQLRRALWANEVTRECLLSCDGDINAALQAAEYIVTTQPIELPRPTPARPLKETSRRTLEINAYFDHDIKNPVAQGILDRAVKASRKLASDARSALERALDTALHDNGLSLMAWMEEYRARLTDVIADAQFAATLGGANEVASKIPETDEPQDVDTFDDDGVFFGPNPGKKSSDSDQFLIINKAVRGLSARKAMTKDRYNALSAAARQKAFTVANVESQETLQKIRDVMAENVRKGADHATFRKAVLDAVESGTFLSEPHLETVFRTNVQTAFSDGQLSVLSDPAIRDGFPYAAYDAIHDDRVRADHLALEKHGIDGSNVYRIDDPVFNTFRPPWAWNCRCSFTPITIRQAAEMGVSEAQGWLNSGIEPATPAYVNMPDFQPTDGFQRALNNTALSIRLAMEPICFATDAHGVEHKGKGKGGGQFVSKGKGGSKGSESNKKTRKRVKGKNNQSNPDNSEDQTNYNWDSARPLLSAMKLPLKIWYRSTRWQYTAGIKAVREIAKKVGGEEHAERVGNICASIDSVSRIVGLFEGTIQTTPFASAVYLVYSGIVRPITTFKAAFEGVGAAWHYLTTGKEQKGAETKLVFATEDGNQLALSNQEIAVITEKLNNVSDPDWYTALFINAMMRTDDVEKAIELTDIANKMQPEPPESTDEEEEALTNKLGKYLSTLKPKQSDANLSLNRIEWWEETYARRQIDTYRAGRIGFGGTGSARPVVVVRGDIAQLGVTPPIASTLDRLSGRGDARTGVDTPHGVSGRDAIDVQEGGEGRNQRTADVRPVVGSGNAGDQGVSGSNQDVRMGRPDNAQDLRETPQGGREPSELAGGTSLSTGEDGRGGVSTNADGGGVDATHDWENAKPLAELYAFILTVTQMAGMDASALLDEFNDELEGTGWAIIHQGNRFVPIDETTSEDDASLSLDAFFANTSKYEIDQVWQGNSGRWFTKKLIHGKVRVVPAKNPRGGGAVATQRKATQRSAERKAAKPTDRAGLERRLQEYGKVEPAGYQQFHKGNARRIAKAILRYHPESAAERIEELTERLEGVLSNVKGDDWRANRIRALTRSRLRELANALYHINNPEVKKPAGDLKPQIVTARPEFTEPTYTDVVPEPMQKFLISPDGSDHQLQGSAKTIYAIDNVGGMLLADGPGAGKTRQMLAVAQTYAARGKKAVLVAPAGVIKPDWRNGTIAGSVGKDGEAMGVSLQLNKGDRAIEPGQVHVTTYEQLAAMKDRIDSDTLVIFDEAHGLKNAESNRSQHGKDVASRALGVVYGTATPADSALDVAYLFRTKLFGDEPWEKVRKQFDPDRVGAPEALRNTADMFDQLTAAGVMIKREISLDGVQTQFDTVQLPEDGKRALESMKAAASSTRERAQLLMRQRFAQEKMKIPAAVNAINEEMAQGRQVVVFVAGVGGTADEPGTAGMLSKALEASGIDPGTIAELHGGEGGGGREVVDAFQKGIAKVLITTAQSGGTGHNLDDTQGDAPRTQLIITAPFSAIDNAQMWGRTHRLTTRSKSRIRYLFADTEVDRWNADLIRNKVKSLGAIVGGETEKQNIPELMNPNA